MFRQGIAGGRTAVGESEEAAVSIKTHDLMTAGVSIVNDEHHSDCTESRHGGFRSLSFPCHTEVTPH